MKPLKFIATAALSLVAAASLVAAPKSQTNTVTQTFEAEIHCQTCEAKVMKTLPFKKGVKDVKVDMAAQEVTVKYDPTKSCDSVIIESLGAVDVKAKVKVE